MTAHVAEFAVDGADQWTVKRGDIVLARRRLDDAHVYQWSFTAQEWRERGLGPVPEGTVGHVEDVNVEVPELLVDFQWQTKDGRLFSALAPLNSDKWVEKLPRLTDESEEA